MAFIMWVSRPLPHNSLIWVYTVPRHPWQSWSITSWVTGNNVTITLGLRFVWFREWIWRSWCGEPEHSVLETWSEGLARPGVYLYMHRLSAFAFHLGLQCRDGPQISWPHMPRMSEIHRLPNLRSVYPRSPWLGLLLGDTRPKQLDPELPRHGLQ